MGAGEVRVLRRDDRDLVPEVLLRVVIDQPLASLLVLAVTLSMAATPLLLRIDDALNRVILALRRLAGEFTPRPFAVETVPRVGHRLVTRRVAHEDVVGGWLRPPGRRRVHQVVPGEGDSPPKPLPLSYGCSAAAPGSPAYSPSLGMFSFGGRRWRSR